MMKPRSYTPMPGSVAYKVIEFLTTHPDEELSRQDISVKFDKPGAQVHSLLSDAVAAGVLKRGETADDSEIVYRLGTGVPSIKPNKGGNPTVRLDALVAGGQLGKKRRLPPPDLTAVPLRDDIPMPAGSGFGKPDWGVLLRRMSVGQSADLARRCRSSITKEISAWKKEGKGRFVVAAIDESTIRIWRTE